MTSKINIIGTRVSLMGGGELLEQIDTHIRDDKRFLVLSGNIHSLNLAFKIKWYRDFFEQADSVRMDGVGLRLGVWILQRGSPPPRSTFADFAWDLAELCERRGYRVFLLGGRKGIPEKARERMKEKHPDLKVVGVHHGYFDKTKGGRISEGVLQTIRDARPDVLIVGMGMPIQERWIKDNWESMSAKVVLTGGAVFDYISGSQRRPPKWMQTCGLEWLGRLIFEPLRLWRRYLIGNPVFAWRLLKQKVGSL